MDGDTTDPAAGNQDPDDTGFITDPALLLAMPAVTDFVDAVRAYCAWADAPPGDELTEVRTALRLLSLLYHRALALPGNVLEAQDVPEVNLPDAVWDEKLQRFRVLPFQFYRVETKPNIAGDGDRGAADLLDGLAFMHRVLLTGLMHFDHGHVAEAVWCWRFSFEEDWGEPTVEALRALHRWMSEMVNEGDDPWSAPIAPPTH